MVEETDEKRPSESSGVRKGEESAKPFRSDRFFQVDGAWFFSTREGIDIGPYSTKEDAEREERNLVKLLENAQNATEAILLIHEFKRRPVTTRGA